MTINELRVKRNQAWEAAKAFVETRRDKDGLLSDEDAKTYAQMEKKVQDYGAEIERMEAMSAMDAQLSKPTSSPITEKPMNGSVSTKTGRAADAYKEDMLKALRTNFRTISNVLSEGIDADGGYLVPEEYDSRLIEGLEEENIFRKLGTTITTSGERKINIAATKPAAAWIDEGEALTFGDATFAQINLDAHKLHVAVKVTEELLYDNAFGLENYIIRQFSKALANAEEDAFLNGTGVGQPLGLLAKDGGAEIGVTAASAIAALQEAGSKLTRDMVKGGYRAFCELNKLAIELIREFYDEPRFFRITLPNGTEDFISYDNSGLIYEKDDDLFGVVIGGRKPVFDIKISSEKSSPFTKISQNELALQLYSAGFFNPEFREQAMLALNMMDFEGKSEVLSRVSNL